MPSPPYVGPGMVSSVTFPLPVILPTLLVLYSVNHIVPPGPAAIWYGPAPGVGTWYSVTVPVGVTRPILSAPNSVNHIEPSGPAAMSNGSDRGVGSRNNRMARTGTGGAASAGSSAGDPGVHPGDGDRSGWAAKKSARIWSPTATPVKPNQLCPPDGKTRPLTGQPGHVWIRYPFLDSVSIAARHLSRSDHCRSQTGTAVA